MTKKYKGKICVYCCTRVSETGDHVFAREFFHASDRANLPKVPSCLKCNGEKSAIEHYLTTVLPFGGRHADAASNLADNVPSRLAKNTKLHNQLERGRSRVWERTRSGILVPTMTIPFDGAKLEKLIAYIAKGLAWRHWQALIGPDCVVQVHSLTKPGEAFYKRFSAMNAKQRVKETVGTGVFSYEGAQGVDNPVVTVWELSLYGGLILSDESGEPVSRFGVMTGPKRISDSAERKHRWRAGRAAARAT